MATQQTKSKKVVVVGLSKTGTSTLKVMLTALGYRVCGPRKALLPAVRSGDMSGADALLEAYDAFEDWPWPYTYRHVAELYGDRARFILSTRASFEAWFASLVTHGRQASPFRGMFDEYGYYRPVGHREAFRRIYEEHNAAVRACFASRPEQLLEFCLENGDGWAALCTFLGEPLPAETEVPWVNRADARRKPLNMALNDLIAMFYARGRS